MDQCSIGTDQDGSRTLLNTDMKVDTKIKKRDPEFIVTYHLSVKGKVVPVLN
jgi:hypothetical protein